MRDDLWAGGVVPYRIQPGLPSLQQVTAAIKLWNSSEVPVQLERYEGQEDYVEFVAESYCSSRRGCVGGHQKITLSPDCSAGVVLHEIGHAVGLAHEHNRHDRDQYLERICLENIYPEALAYFQPRPDEGDELGEYDFGSIMHYSQMAFSRNRGRTIVPMMDRVPSGALIGQRQKLSAGDIQRLRDLYRPATGKPGDTTRVATGSGRNPQRTFPVGIVRGSIIVPPKAPTASEIHARVRVRDLTYSDAPKRPLAAESNTIVTVAPDARIDFSVDVPEGRLPEGSTPSIEVHIDLDGNGYFSPGDLVSMAPHWLLPATPDTPIDIPVSVI